MKIMIDGLFIRSLLMAFFFKVFPEIILDGRLFIAEPPLYRVDDAKNPFVINKEDYINRYVKVASKEYKVGTLLKNKDIEFFDKKFLTDFLTATSSYVDDLQMLTNHFRINDRLLEIILEEFAANNAYTPQEFFNSTPHNTAIQTLVDRIGEEFPEIYFDDRDQLIKGVIDGQYQLLEISDSLIWKSRDLIALIQKWGSDARGKLVLRSVKTGTETETSLLGVLKILKKYQPNILHRFKGLGENDAKDIEQTIMNPNTRTLIRVNVGDIENDMKVFQVLRGGSPLDAQARKAMMKQYTIPRDLIDT